MSRRSRTPGQLVACLLVVAATVAGCGNSDFKRPLGAAEPAVAPTSSQEQGTVVAVGDAPEGIVYDAVTGLVAVAVRNPDRLVLLDGATLKIIKSVPLAGHARHLQLARPGGPVLVPEEDANTLAVVALPAGGVTESKTGVSPHDATAVDGGYVAGDELGGSITLLPASGPARTVTGLMQPGGVIGFGDQVAVVDVGEYTASTYRVSDGKRIAKLPAGKGPTHGVRTADGQLVVVDTRGEHILRYTETPLAQRSSTPLPGTPYGLASDPSAPRIWVTLTARNQVVGLDVTSTGVTEFARLDTVRQPDTVAVEPGSHVVFVTGTRSGVVQRLTR